MPRSLWRRSWHGRGQAKRSIRDDARRELRRRFASSLRPQRREEIWTPGAVDAPRSGTSQVRQSMAAVVRCTGRRGTSDRHGAGPCAAPICRATGNVDVDRRGWSAGLGRLVVELDVTRGGVPGRRVDWADDRRRDRTALRRGVPQSSRASAPPLARVLRAATAQAARSRGR